MKMLVCLVLLSLLRESIQVTPSPPYRCSDTYDVVLVFASGSNGFPALQRAATSLVTAIINNNNPNIRIGAVNANNPGNAVPLTTAANGASLLNFINSLTSFNVGSPATANGIDAALTTIRPGGSGNPASIVIFTNSLSQNTQLTLQAANRARDASVRLFAIAINAGNSLREELYGITLDQGTVFLMANEDQLDETAATLGASLCAYSVCSGCNVDAGRRVEPHPSRSDKFYLCERREDEPMKAYEKNCPIGNLWHRRFLTCVPSEMALADPNSGSSYCNTQLLNRNTYQLGDSCEIYYECNVNRTALNVRCCGIGQRYDFSSDRCIPGQCVARRYRDKDSCRGYYTCNAGASGSIWTRNCCQGQYFSETSQQCQDNTRCRGDCTNSRIEACDEYEPHPTDMCKFRSRNGKELSCAAGTSYSQAECRCVSDIINCPIPTTPPTATVCEPDFVIPVTSSQEESWGFSDSSGKYNWIDVHDVVYENGAVVLGRERSGFMSIPYFANNEAAFVENTVFFRVSVKDEFPSNLVSRNRVVLDNKPCNGGFSEAGDEPSVWITISGASQMVTFGVRTVNGRGTVDLAYPIGGATWKELTLRYDQSPGLLEGDLKVYNVVNGRRQYVGVPQRSSVNTVSGRILTSDCGMRIGQSVSPVDGFIGVVDDVVIYNQCKKTVPQVDAANPSGFSLVPE